ncbi:MAG: hypothetical protein O7I42_13655 [Alphaproteobacteria bacterium]|nr:hypothetical protein [Alphaproteobacteria bacterium]
MRFVTGQVLYLDGCRLTNGAIEECAPSHGEDLRVVGEFVGERAPSGEARLGCGKFHTNGTGSEGTVTVITAI